MLNIGISSCLLGEKVRYNGGHKHNTWITNTLGKQANFTSICPEVGIGLAVPRPTLRLIKTSDGIEAVDSNTQTLRVGEALREYFHQRQDTLKNLDGYIVMQGSPSCGMDRVKLYTPNQDMPEKTGTGLFTEQLMTHMPYLPVEEAGRLSDPNIKESFLSRLYVYHQWRTEKPYQSKKKLIDFHSRHKLLIQLHDINAYQETGRLLSNLSKHEHYDSLCTQYLQLVMDALKKTSKLGHRLNSLQHLLGFIKHFLSHEEKRLILQQITQYQSGLVPYCVPLTLLRHYACLHQDKARYINQQSIWQPYPIELNKPKHAL